jgi:hypothetical protein
MTLKITVFFLVLLGLVVLVFTPTQARIKALVYNATGEDLHLIVNGRMHLAPARHQINVFRTREKDKLLLETANTNGEMLTSHLEDEGLYIILFKESSGAFVLWSLDELNQRLNDLLNSHSGRHKAVIFNASGLTIKGRFKDSPFQLDRTLSLLFPTARDSDELQFEVASPSFLDSGLLQDRSASVLIDREEGGLILLPFNQWVEDLKARLEKE